MLNQTFYWGIIRSTIVGFGRLFSDIYIERKSGDSVNGTTVQTLQIPLSYGPKEKWLSRIEEDPNLTENAYTILPRMAFEITGYAYDSSRKLNKMNKIRCNTGTNPSSIFTPVPYNVDITLSILTKNQEDALQIIEQILPTFTPEYTLSIKAVSGMNIIQDIPVILNSITATDDYESDYQTRRSVIHELSFTLKTNLFGGVKNESSNIILDVNTNIIDKDTNHKIKTYEAIGDESTFEIISEDWLENF